MCILYSDLKTHGLVLQNLFNSNTKKRTDWRGVTSLFVWSTTHFCFHRQPFYFYSVFMKKDNSCSIETLTHPPLSQSGNVTPIRLQARSCRRQRPQELQLGLQGDPLLVNHLQLLLEFTIKACQHSIGFPVLTNSLLDLPLLSGQQLLSRFNRGRKWHGRRRYSLQVLALWEIFPANWLLWRLIVRSSSHVLLRRI